MEHLFYDFKTLFGIDEKKYEYVYHPSLKDGSMLIYLIDNYDLNKLKDVLNYHKIENKKNLLSHNLFNTHFDIFFEEQKEKYILFLHNFLSTRDFNEFNPVLEHVILNESEEYTQFIINEMFYDPFLKNSTVIDYGNLTISFVLAPKKSNLINRFIVSTVIKILLEKDNLSDNIVKNCIKALNIVGNYVDDYLVRFLIFLLHFKNIKNDLFKMYITAELDKIGKRFSGDITWSKIVLNNMGISIEDYLSKTSL